VELIDVEYHGDLEMWVRGHSTPLKLVPFESLGACGFLFAFQSNVREGGTPHNDRIK